MDVSGSCPLCLTPPCYHFEPPATAAPFFVPFRGRPCPHGYHFVNIAAERLDRFVSTRSYRTPGWVRRHHMKERSADEAAPIVFGEKLASSQAFAALFRDGMSLVEETAAYLDGAGPPGIQEARTQCGAGLCHREHAADHAADAARLVAPAAPRGQGRRDDAFPGQQRKIQGEARRPASPAIRKPSSSCRNACAC